jgi:hypothetical protein
MAIYGDANLEPKTCPDTVPLASFRGGVLVDVGDSHPAACAGKMGVMPDMRRNGPEPTLGLPQIQMKPGMADEMMRDLAPLLAEDGVDINDITDIDAFNRALQKAVERRNMELFTPVGARRDQAIALLMLVVAAIADDDSKRAGTLLDKAQPESPDNSAPEVSSCIGIALGLLDSWLTGQDSHAPVTLAQLTRLPAGHWFGQRAAVNVLALAGRGRAFQSLGSLITKQGSPQLLAGATLALAAAVMAWSRTEDTPVGELLPTLIR